MFKLTILREVGIFVGAMLFLTAGVSYAQEEMGIEHIGKASFTKNCAVCHGAGGKGNGPFLDFLKQKPADLTLISERNLGVYPQKEVYAWIRDPQRLRAHGSKDMPIWGDTFSKEIIEVYGPDYTGPGSSVQGRILELVFYIGTIQK